MKTLFLILALSSLSAVAAPSIQVGDILLQPTDCWSCSLIEAEEESIYSHMGIVLQTEPEIMVAEALGKVRLVPYSVFNSKTEKGQKIAILRYSNTDLVNHILAHKDELLALFKSDFENLAYDHAFLWDNVDGNGNQMLYCSEMVAKLLQAFLGIDTPIKRMHFSKYPEQWDRYFKGNVPVGKWGNSPADFEKSDKFHIEGEL